MKQFGKFIAENKTLVLIIAVLLLIPSIYGMVKTKVNYDMLTYIPKSYDSVKGQEILDKEFSNAANSMLIIEKMDVADIVSLKEKISKVDGVDKVIWVNDIVDTSIPKEILPDEIKDTFYSKDSTMMIIKYKNAASSEETQKAIENIRNLMGKQCFLSGASAIIKDTKDLADKQTPIYVALAVILCAVVLALTMESTLIPIIFLLGIFFAIMYNFGTNVFFGDISYVTKSLAAVLQLGVTMDYSIFLLHRYEEEKARHESKEDAMAKAIYKTFSSITGSSLTTIAGFISLCAMQLLIGKDIGLVMAKGVFLGVISTIVILPALILTFDGPIHRFRHKMLLPEFNKLANFVTKNYKILIIVFIILFVPAIYGQSRAQVYYNLDESLPKDLPSIIATNKLKKDYNMTTTHFVIVSNDIPSYSIKNMSDEIKKIDGITKVISYDNFIGPMVPGSFVPDELRDIFKSDDYKLILVNSKYKAATDEENQQINMIKDVVKKHDPKGLVAGEAPLTKDLIEIADKDFKIVNYVSIAAIFVIIMLLFKSIFLPFLLVAAIELAIYINMAIPYYTNTTIPFIASIVIGCIQLGATVDYAILVTTRFKEELSNKKDKFEAMNVAVKESAKSVVSSALTFFAATGVVAVVSKISMIKTLCAMISRGALISMMIILIILPSILLVFEKIIGVTTFSWRNTQDIKERD